MVYQDNLLPMVQASHLSLTIPAAPLWIQLLGKQLYDGLSAWAPAPTWDLEDRGSQTGNNPALAIMAVWALNQQVEDLSISFYLSFPLTVCVCPSLSAVLPFKKINIF